MKQKQELLKYCARIIPLYSTVVGNVFFEPRNEPKITFAPKILLCCHVIGSFRFQDEDEHEDEDEALCFRHNEIFKLFRLQLGLDDEVDCNNIVATDLSMRTMSKSWTWSSFSSSSSNLKLAINWSQMTSKCGKNKKVAHDPMCACVAEILTSSVIYCRTDARLHGIYLFYTTKTWKS